MKEYLTSAPVIATRSVEAARDAVGRTYLRHELVSIHGAIDMRLNTVASPHLTVGYLTYQAETQLTMPRARRTPTSSTSPSRAAPWARAVTATEWRPLRMRAGWC